MHLSLILTTSDTKESFSRPIFVAVSCHAFSVANQGSRDISVGTDCPIFVATEEREKCCESFLTTLLWRNVRIPADVHNTSLALAVAMGTLAGKLQRQTDREKCGVGVERQTEQRR